RGGAARGDDRSAAGEDPRHLLDAEALEAAVDEAAPAFEHGDAVPALRVRATDDRADDRVQARAVAAAGEQADRLRHRRKSYRSSRLRRRTGARPCAVRRVGIEPTRPKGQWLLRP